jgi:predicted nicotinamide N-methyase
VGELPKGSRRLPAGKPARAFAPGTRGTEIGGMSDLEPDLRRRFDLREEQFTHGPFSVDLLLPRSADELIDVSAFNTDERLPYWAELWPSARALTRWALDAPLPAGPALELGSGVALPSLALRWRGARAVASDYYPEALEFARANAIRNAIPPPRTLLLDWRDPPTDLGRFPLVLAADVLYERRNADSLLDLLPRVTEPGGRVVIADPGRVHAADFRAALESRGWRVREISLTEEASGAPGSGAVSQVGIWELSPP